MVKILDLKFQGHSHTIASFLLETAGGPLLIETGPYSTYPNLERALNEAGYEAKDIRHVLLTHIHLDHAGAAWALAQQGATIYLHPFGAKHLAEPAKLLKSARRIYQDDMDRLWGDLQPIPAKQLKEVAHEEVLSFGVSKIKAWHTPGHAVHHIAWQIDNLLFTGDVAGVKIDDGFVQPPCPPPDINLEDWENSIALIKKLELNALYLTHFGKVSNIHEHLDTLQSRLWEWAEWIRPRWEKDQNAEDITPEFRKFAEDQLKQAGIDEEVRARYEAANPAWMSVAGLMRYWQKREG